MAAGQMRLNDSLLVGFKFDRHKVNAVVTPPS
jgi:hypothetical protein